MAFIEATLNSLPLLRSTSYLNTSTVIALCVFFSLLCACIVIGHLLEESRWVNASIIALFLGLCSGGVVLLVTKFCDTEFLDFSENLFFLYLLPPIIFNAGFQVKKKQFFKNFTTILLFGVIGTVVSFCFISFGAYFLLRKIGLILKMQDYLAIGAIFSATDSVCTLQVLSQDETPLLYSIVFGEGVVNDATSIVLYNSVQSLDFSSISATTALNLLGTFLYLFLTSTVLGISVGLLSAFTIKTLYFGRHSTDREVALMMLMAYLSYMIAELLSLSGILTIFFCGIVMSHYTWHNVTESSRITTKHAFATISNASVGTSIAISSTFLALVLVGRAIFVFPISNIKNCIKTRESSKIEFQSQFVIWWAGLLRGAVTIALCYYQFGRERESTQEGAAVITSTIIVVLFSTVVFGPITKPLIQAVQLRLSKPPISESSENAEDFRLLLLESGGPSDQGNNQPVRRRSRLSLLISHPTSTVHYYWRKFDDKYMRPIFGGNGFVPFVPVTPSESNRAGDAAPAPDN
ncbi:hypothetical protein K1719_024882 [Acacia pycnantha]|nr:hypothetical protein K1719_024882 [Acacia pycnantha]